MLIAQYAAAINEDDIMFSNMTDSRIGQKEIANEYGMRSFVVVWDGKNEDSIVSIREY